MKKTCLLLTLILSMILCFAVGCSGSKDDNKAGDDTAKTATLILVLEDKTEVKYELNITSESSLRQTLFDNELITEETFGAMFVEDIDGHIASVLEDGCTWMPQNEDREQIMGTFDDITVKEGQTIYLEYYVVPDFD